LLVSQIRRVKLAPLMPDCQATEWFAGWPDNRRRKIEGRRATGESIRQRFWSDSYLAAGAPRKQVMEPTSLAFVERAENVAFLRPSAWARLTSRSRSAICESLKTRKAGLLGKRRNLRRTGEKWQPSSRSSRLRLCHEGRSVLLRRRRGKESQDFIGVDTLKKRLYCQW